MSKKDKSKDIFYNAIDYLIMLVIIIGVVTLLGWKFEILFNKTTTTDSKEATVSADDISITNTTEQKTNNENNSENSQSSNTNTEDENNNVSENTNNTSESNNTQQEENINQPTENTSNNSETNNQTNTETQPTNQTPAPTETNTSQEITITIPQGSLPGKVGEILVNNGLVSSKEEFVNTAVQLKLDRSLKSGNFTLKKGMTIEEIVRAIAKK